jgi:hypothetical protein
MKKDEGEPKTPMLGYLPRFLPFLLFGRKVCAPFDDASDVSQGNNKFAAQSFLTQLGGNVSHK